MLQRLPNKKENAPFELLVVKRKFRDEKVVVPDTC